MARARINFLRHQNGVFFKLEKDNIEKALNTLKEIIGE